MLPNLENIKTNGIEHFIAKQKTRMGILSDFLNNYDDGRAKSFFCQTCALLPINKLQEIQNELQNAITNVDLKEKCKFARNLIIEISKK